MSAFSPPGFTPAAGAPAPKPSAPLPTTPAKPVPWRHISHGHQQAIEQIEGRRNGTIKSVKTPWPLVDDVGMAGLEWHTTMILGARPGVGKTMLASEISNKAHQLNPDQKFMCLDFQFEMMAKTMAMRELSAHLGKSVKYLNSAEMEPGTKFAQLVDGKVLEQARSYVDSQKSRRHYVVETAMDPNQIEQTVTQFYKTYGLPMIITLDHSMLTKRCPTDKDAQDMLHSLGKMCTRTERAMPIIWIILSQLNREIDSALRQEKPGSPGNYPNDSDLFGGDALLHHADIVGLLNRPAKYNLAIYGPERYVVDKNLIAVHFTKVRNGSPCIVIFEADFAKSTLRQVDSPKLAPSARGAAPGFPV